MHTYRKEEKEEGSEGRLKKEGKKKGRKEKRKGGMDEGKKEK